ncbi:MAG: DNA-deoxyinosine glycosylase [Bacilli bacterium]|jgi:hypoxanthine-DNA glycosylase|nr:DNA-deoxyinosine glycosylase [Bacilli bacterium]
MSVNKAKIRSLSHPFPLLYDENSTVLILGSFPSVKAVADGYYYANPNNRFYKMMSVIFETDFVSIPWEKKKELLLQHHLALHDSIGYCQILGSSDAKISDVKPSNLHEIFSKARIKKVICNGAKAYHEYIRFFSDIDIPVVQAPSTSPANAKMQLDDLVSAWKAVLHDVLSSINT